MESKTGVGEEHQSEAEDTQNAKNGIRVATDVKDVRGGEHVAGWATVDPGRRRCQRLRTLPVPKSWRGLLARRGERGTAAAAAAATGQPEAGISELALLAADANCGVEKHPHQQDKQQQQQQEEGRTHARSGKCISTRRRISLTQQD